MKTLWAALILWRPKLFFMEHSRIYISSHISKKAQSVNVFSFILMRDCPLGLNFLQKKFPFIIYFHNYQALGKVMELNIEINFSIMILENSSWLKDREFAFLYIWYFKIYFFLSPEKFGWLFKLLLTICFHKKWNTNPRFWIWTNQIALKLTNMTRSMGLN